MVRLPIFDKSKTDGSLVSGLSSSSTNLRISYMREFDSALTSYTGANIETITTIGTYQAPSSSSKCRFKETPVPGWYEIHFHNSASIFGTGDDSEKVLVIVAEDETSPPSTSLNIGFNFKEIQLSAFDLQVATQKADVDSIKASSAAATLLSSSCNLLKSLTVDDTDFSPTTTQFETAEAPSAEAGILVDRCVVFVSGGIATQAAVVADYYKTVNNRGHWTVTTMVDAPVDGDTALLI